MINNYDYNYLNNMNNVNNMNQSLAEPYEAFVKGNLFNNLYDPYKNYKPNNLNPNNEQEYALLLVQIYDFCTHELTLYLDNYPNDSNMIRLRDEYSKALKESINNYEMKYGPLSLSSNTLSVTPWAWDTKKWPWEGNN